ncbi:MAG: site-specific integrase [Pseudomonadota bacterium]|nr:site-specific integrase [Pseudomonadota bacterium]
MALEQIFSCPKTLARLQNEPLGCLLEGFCFWLIDRGFSRSTIRTHLSYVSHFNAYLGAEDTPREVVTAQDIEGFFRAYPLQCRNRGPLEQHLHDVHGAINRFIDYLREKGVFQQSLASPLYQPLLNAYRTWMQEQRHVGAGTLAVRCHSLSGFLRRLGTQATADGLAQLTGDQVERLFLAQAQGMGQAARRALQSAVRTFLRFCLACGTIHQPLDQAVPTLRTYRLSTVPRALSEEQAHKVLESVDRRSAIGRRDYAILLLLYTFGVRSGQVRALRLDDIHWSENRILFRAMKNGKDACLPLTEAVGEALLVYLQQGRPAYVCPQVFLTTRAPYRPLRRSSNVAQIVRLYVREAGIDTPRRGAHAFRHGFATRMLRQGHSLKAIADVLGHRRLSTTFGYTKVDFNRLDEVALGWPQEERTC